LRVKDRSESSQPFLLFTNKSLPFGQKKQVITAEIVETAETNHSKTKEFSAVRFLAAVVPFLVIRGCVK
jgi:hypothetical protein